MGKAFAQSMRDFPVKRGSRLFCCALKSTPIIFDQSGGFPVKTKRSTAHVEHGRFQGDSNQKSRGRGRARGRGRGRGRKGATICLLTLRNGPVSYGK